MSAQPSGGYDAARNPKDGKPPKRTEADMLALLRARHAKDGNGGSGEWAFLTHVRNAAGFGATRTIDALALSLWPSRGFEMHGFEVKVSRSDWLRELADPAKADGVMARCDRWWLVASEGVAKPGEMPVGWGLLVAQGDKLRAAVQAPRLPRTDEERRISRDWLVCLLRAAGSVPKSRPEDVEAAYNQGFTAGGESARRGDKQWQQMYERATADLNALRDQVRAFERESGFGLAEYGDRTTARAVKAGALVKAALEGDRAIVANRDRLLRFADEMDRAVQRLRDVAGAADSVVEGVSLSA